MASCTGVGPRGDALVDGLRAAEAMPSLPREQTVRTTGRVAGSLLRWWAAYYWAWEYGLWADGDDA